MSTVKLASVRPYALVLETREATKAERYEGYDNARELHENMKENLGAVRLKNADFQEELERRLTHTPEMVDLLKKQGELLGQDLSQYIIYGSYRPVSASWARVHEQAVYIQVDPASTGYHTYVAVPARLDVETIENYELQFVSHPVAG